MSETEVTQHSELDLVKAKLVLVEDEAAMWQRRCLINGNNLYQANEECKRLADANTELNQTCIRRGQELDQAKEWGEAMMREHQGLLARYDASQRIREVQAGRVEEKQAEIGRLGGELDEAYAEVRRLRARFETEVVVKAERGGRAEVNPQNDSAAQIAAQADTIRQQRNTIERQSGNLRAYGERIDDLSGQLRRQVDRIDELTDRLKAAHAKTKRAGEAIGQVITERDTLRAVLARVQGELNAAEAQMARMVATMNIPWTRLMAAIRLSEAITALTAEMAGQAPIGTDRQVLLNEYESAHRAYLDHRGGAQ